MQNLLSITPKKKIYELLPKSIENSRIKGLEELDTSSAFMLPLEMAMILLTVNSSIPYLNIIQSLYFCLRTYVFPMKQALTAHVLDAFIHQCVVIVVILTINHW